MFGVVVALLLLLFVLNKRIKRNALKYLSCDRSLSKNRVEIGEELKIITVLENRGLLPIPFLRIIERVPAQIQYRMEQEDFDTVDEKNHEWSVSLLPKQRIKRSYPAVFKRRGRFLFRNIFLYGGDFLGLSEVAKEIERLSDVVVYPKALDLDTAFIPYGSYYGDISIRRWIISDPILSVGVREYTGNEPQKNIHWASSVRSGKLMVKNFDFTTNNEVMIIVNIETGKPFCTSINAGAIEDCISTARSMMERFEESGIPYGFVTNAHTKESQGAKGYIDAGQGSAHFYEILELLGRADYHLWMEFEEVMDQFIYGMDTYETFVIITPSILKEYIDPIHELKRNVGKMLIITMEEGQTSDLREDIQVFMGREDR